MQREFYIDLLSPSNDLNASMEALHASVGVLYPELWKTHKAHHYENKPFDLHIQAFTDLWFGGAMSVFVMYDKATKKPIGFATGTAFRPMSFKASVFQIQEWFVKDGSPEEEKALLDFVCNSIRILKCDEVWAQSYEERRLPTLDGWDLKPPYTMLRYTKE